VESLRKNLKIKNILNCYHRQDSKPTHCKQNSTEYKYTDRLGGSTGVYLLTEIYRACSGLAIVEVMVTMMFENRSGFINGR